MKYNEIMSETNLTGKFVRSTEEERNKYKKVLLHVTEKIDGENWRLGIENGRRFIGGRNHLFWWDEIANEFIHEFTHNQYPNWSKINEKTKEEIFRVLDELEKAGRLNILLYGELYGTGLKKKFQFKQEGYSVIYYEVAIDEKYVDQEIAFGWFEGLRLDSVPYIGKFTLEDFLEIDVEEMKSDVAINPYIEGLVGVPVGGSFEWGFADRFIIKKKTIRSGETEKVEGLKQPKYVSPFIIHVTEERLNHILQALAEDGHLFSHEKDFRMMAVEKMIDNIRDEENEHEDFTKEDRKALTTEAHKVFSQYRVI